MKDKIRQDKIGSMARAWFYFRMGYNTYLTFMLGALNTLVVIWYLAISHVPSIQNFFLGNFITFAIVVTVIGIPAAVTLGLIHYKRSPIFSTENDIAVESNPYFYKYAPGYTKDAWGPLFLELLDQQKRLLELQGALTDEDRSRIEILRGKLELLNEGGAVSWPKGRNRPW